MKDQLLVVSTPEGVGAPSNSSLQISPGLTGGGGG